MSAGNNGKYLAIGIIIGIAISFTILIWSVPGFIDPSKSSNKFLPFVTKENTLTQWIMAVGSIAATGISILAVVLLRGTLTASNKAVKSADDAVVETRRIGEAQTRAYLSIVPSVVPALKGSQLDTKQEFSFEISNVGQTPARNVRYIAFAAPQVRQFPTPCPDLVQPSDGSPDTAFTIGVGGSVGGMINSKMTMQDILREDTVDDGKTPHVFGIVWYDDVFGKNHQIRFAYRAQTLVLTDSVPKVGETLNISIELIAANAHNDEL